MKPFFFLFALVALTGCDSQSPDAAAPLPAAMMVNGQPIDPLCFGGQDAQNVPIQLNACRSDDLMIPATASLIPDEQGLIGYEYGYKTDDGSEPAIGAFAKYRYLGMVDGHHAVFSIQNGGGSGVFTTVSTFDRVGDTLVRVRDYAGGDRCNGGTTTASVADGHLLYSVNLTPPDILALGGLTTGYEAYTDLEASAASCFAVADYQDGALTGLTLNPDALQDRADWTENYPVQACFNRLARDSQARLDPAGLRAFAQAFRDSCQKDK